MTCCWRSDRQNILALGVEEPLACHIVISSIAANRAAAIHGDMDQHTRMTTLGDFKESRHHVLVRCANKTATLIKSSSQFAVWQLAGIVLSATAAGGSDSRQGRAFLRSRQ